MQATRFLTFSLAAIALTACEKSADIQPDWSRATIEGLSPLMSVAAAEAALKSQGYRETLCPTGMLPKYCYKAEGKPMTIMLDYVDLPEGKRTATVEFLYGDSSISTQMTDEELLEKSRAFAQEFESRIGAPTDTWDLDPSEKNHLWNLPGSAAKDPDSILITINYRGPKASMKSAWAVRHAQ
jgi:hypothetical protein